MPSPPHDENAHDENAHEAGAHDAGADAPARGVADRVAARLLDMITTGELTPGQRLPGERQLAEQMEVSRVSVRAALQKLKAQGFLTAVQGGGTRVVSSAAAMDSALTRLVQTRLDHLLDLAEMRVALESWAARRAAERATPEQIAEIRARFDDMAAGGPGRTDASDKGYADVQFHFAIGKAADSPVYMHILSVIRDILLQMLAFHRYRLFMSPEDDQTVLNHHRAICDAIAAHAPDDAAAAMERHLKWVLAQYRAARARAEA